jgi:hypothetical protein
MHGAMQGAPTAYGRREHRQPSTSSEGITMNRYLLAAAVVSAFAASTAQAGDAGTINRAATYEQTLRFYLHPAHGFSRDVNTNGDHPAVIVFRRDANATDPALVTIHSHPAVEPRAAHATLA